VRVAENELDPLTEFVEITLFEKEKIGHGVGEAQLVEVVETQLEAVADIVGAVLVFIEAVKGEEEIVLVEQFVAVAIELIIALKEDNGVGVVVRGIEGEITTVPDTEKLGVSEKIELFVGLNELERVGPDFDMIGEKVGVCVGERVGECDGEVVDSELTVAERETVLETVFVLNAVDSKEDWGDHVDVGEVVLELRGVFVEFQTVGDITPDEETEKDTDEQTHGEALNVSVTRGEEVGGITVGEGVSKEVGEKETIPDFV